MLPTNNEDGNDKERKKGEVGSRKRARLRVREREAGIRVDRYRLRDEAERNKDLDDDQKSAGVTNRTPKEKCAEEKSWLAG